MLGDLGSSTFADKFLLTLLHHGLADHIGAQRARLRLIVTAAEGRLIVVVLEGVVWRCIDLLGNQRFQTLPTVVKNWQFLVRSFSGAALARCHRRSHRCLD